MMNHSITHYVYTRYVDADCPCVQKYSRVITWLWVSRQSECNGRWTGNRGTVSSAIEWLPINSMQWLRLIETATPSCQTTRRAFRNRSNNNIAW